jgi:hypothetical protein
MWTLTLREATVAEDRPGVVRKVQAFTRRLRVRFPRLRWLAVLEWHPGGHGWHVHMVVDRFVAKTTLADLWSHGFVDARRISVKGDSSSAQARSRAASYVAKYVAKPAGEGAPAHVKGDHRYLRPLGMTWTEVEAEGDFERLVAVAFGWWPAGIGWMWASHTAADWRGPPCVVMRRA